MRNVLFSPLACATPCQKVSVYLRECSAGRMSRFILGTSPRQPSPAALVSFLLSPLSRGALRSAGVLTIAASMFLASRLARLSWPGRRPRYLENSCQARGNTPCAPSGGLCGRLAVRQTFSEADWGYLPVGDAFHRQILSCRPPLGVLRRYLQVCLFALCSCLPTATWGIYDVGKQMRPAASPAQAGRAARPRGCDARRPSDLVDSRLCRETVGPHGGAR